MAEVLKPRPYQEEAITFLYERDRAMILAPVGAGKTMITLTAMAEMLRDGAVTRWLVVAPKRVCTDVWPVEVKKWAPGLRMSVAIGTAADRRAAFAAKTDVVVVNYDNLDKLPDVPFDGVVFDELTRLKNPSGKRFKALAKVLDRFKVRWGLTGSFTSNGLEDVFGQCKVIDEALLGRAKGARPCHDLGAGRRRKNHDHAHGHGRDAARRRGHALAGRGAQTRLHRRVAGRGQEVGARLAHVGGHRHRC